MTDRINCLQVVLEKDVRDDDVQPLITAILQLRGVATVGQNVADLDDFIAFSRARRELGEKLLDIVYPKAAAGT